MVSFTIAARIIARDRCCFYCGEDFVDEHGKLLPNKADIATVDHLWPAGRLGSNSPTNLVAACHSCNSKRGDFLPAEYAEHACCEDHARRMATDATARPPWLAVDEYGRLRISEKYFPTFIEKLFEQTAQRVRSTVTERAQKIQKALDSRLTDAPSPSEAAIAAHLKNLRRSKSK
jgi:hypothetical protein